jgi:uncharacterized protein (TIGR02449 family)
MSRLEDLADRIDRLVLRHEELKRTNALLNSQLTELTSERNNLKSRLSAARARIDALIDRLPTDEPGTSPAVAHTPPMPPASHRDEPTA